MMYRGTAKTHDRLGYEDGYRDGRADCFNGKRYIQRRSYPSEYALGYSDAYARLTSAHVNAA